MPANDALYRALMNSIESTLEQHLDGGPEQNLSLVFANYFTTDYYHLESHLFVLRYGCSVTSISYGELRSLLRYSVTPKKENIYISFHSSRSLRHDLATIWDTLVSPTQEFQELSEKISALYATSNDKNKFANNYVQLSNSHRYSELKKLVVERTSSRISGIHGASLRGLIILDAYHSTCAVAISKDLEIDTASIVGRSGYIHSAGQLLYIRNAAKFEASACIVSLRRYHASISEASGSSGRLPFFLMANEHLDPYDHSRPDAGGGSGIVQTRIPKDKYFIGGQPAGDFWDAILLDRDLARIVSPMPGEEDPHTEIRDFEKNNQRLNDHCLFLLRDFGIDERGSRSNKQYLILYARQFRNSSPFVIFDESKPGWYAPVTAPHTLTAAMLNLCLPNLMGRQRDRPLVVCDPFVGSGTSILEAHKLPGSVRFIAGDLSKPAQFARNDNLLFFSLPQKDQENDDDCKNNLLAPLATLPLSIDGILNLLSCITSTNLKQMLGDALEEATTISTRTQATSLDSVKQAFPWAAARLLEHLRSNAPAPSRTQAGIRTLREADFSEVLTAFSNQRSLALRLLIYLVWRSILRVGPSLYREGKKRDRQIEILTKAVQSELDTFKSQCKNLSKIREMRPEDQVVTLGERLLIQKGWYCPEIISPRIAVGSKEAGFVLQDGGQVSALDLLKDLERQVDLLVTDPPYAFNTDDYEKNLDLYRELPGAIVRSMNDGGQAVICLPEQSHNGQNIPSYARKSWFVRAFIAEAAQNSAKVVNVGETRPSVRVLFDSPYYWRSSRALTRSVLHFTIRRN
ncbi:putative RNA methylase family UPF0020 [Rhodopseudomonas thermotolerans]|uniref:RNA methylase family UPF0020 n=2 Tax=Rhodopseudomonas TaxID=1073 RepID=A0A336JKJ6_9BRAD|nr:MULTISPECIES: hypothetical protein [Rhodopseudomonas]RED37695.1 putative RNA methylase family UPF0020 [Rhodopseudomonas pentothenatexigens]REG04429.1 putative RNA methylase family UPF0020 [Rhodopseudomonas thermotolerans]SSW90195.1 putative RNA methylase family UPF0020 [Rhodopseudomonas pentothenatexigens]